MTLVDDSETKPLTLSGVLRDLLEDDATPDEAAAIVLKRPDLPHLVFSVVRGEAVHIQRTITRGIIRSMQMVGDPPTVSPLETRAKLIRERFALPDSTWVSYLEATAEQHLARAGWQREHAAATVADAEFHEACARTIVQYGVKCLSDIPPEKRPKKAN